MSTRDEILSMFVSNDDLRPELMKPWNCEGCVGATNGHVMVLLNGEDVRYSRFILRERTSVAYLFPERDGERHLSALALQAVLDSIPHVPAKEKGIEECWACGGTGECTCMDCNVAHDCGQCDGTGEIEGEVDSPTVRVPDKFAQVFIGKILYCAQYVNLLVKVANMLQTDDIVNVSPEELTHAQEFLIGEARLLVMPMRQDIATEKEKAKRGLYRCEYKQVNA